MSKKHNFKIKVKFQKYSVSRGLENIGEGFQDFNRKEKGSILVLCFRTMFDLHVGFLHAHLLS